MGEVRDGDPTAAGRPEDRPGHGDHPDTPAQRPSWDPVVSPDGRRSSAFETPLSGEQESALVDASTAGGDRRATLPTELLRRFDPTSVGLDDMTTEQAEAYIAANADRRPWLAPASDQLPEVKRVIAVMDSGQGHALQRHEGAVTDEMTMQRVTQLRDPAIADPRERVPGKDAYRGGLHCCGRDATRITDPAVFVTAFIRAVEHPKTREAFKAPFDSKKEPEPVDIDLAELLGPGAAKYCAGHRLDAIDGSYHKARKNRDASIRDGSTSVAPTAGRLARADFEGATLHIAFRPNRTRTAWEPATVYVNPHRNRPKGKIP